MKREIGKWFLDIAKYIVTAVILKELFGGFEEKSIVVSVATGTALFAFISGVLLLRGIDKKDNINKENLIEDKKDEMIDRSVNNEAVPAPKRSSNKKKGKRK